jgi:hypothetical protein
MRNDRAILSNVLSFDPQTRKRQRRRELRAAAANYAIYSGIAFVVVVGLWVWVNS